MQNNLKFRISIKNTYFCQKLGMTYPNPNKETILIDAGLTDYSKCWDFQEMLLQKTVAIKLKNRDKSEDERVITPNYLIVCQHPHVYTLGKSGDVNNLLLNEKQLQENEVSFHHINRGGDITYHGPGQIVVYPIFDLENFQTDLHVFLRNIEETIIETIANYNIEGHRIKGLTGVWINPDKNPRKIAAIGIRCSRWVSMHGLALNINTDLNFFNHIIPCGIQDKGVTSVSHEKNQIIDFEESKKHMIDAFSKIFEVNFTLPTVDLKEQFKNIQI